jgi:hypothetical protein
MAIGVATEAAKAMAKNFLFMTNSQKYVVCVMRITSRAYFGLSI